MATLQLENVKKSFGTVDVIKGVNLDVADGELVVFVGPSGCGKSTLLRMIAGLEDGTAGTISIDGEICNDKAPKERGIAMVFQSYALYPHKTVYQNMAFALKLSRRPKDEIDARIREAAQILQMEHLLDRRPSQLSGGQRQRVAIGRAIVRHPKVFLFDEPLSNLDASLRVSMRREIARLHAELGATMIYVTHDQVEAMTLADRIVVLDAGRVQQIGRPLELYQHPKNLFVAGFIGSPKMNFTKGKVTGVHDGRIHVSSAEFDQMQVAVADNVRVDIGAPVTLGIRPEDIDLLKKTTGGASAVVSVVEELGDETMLEVETGAGASFVIKAGPETGAKIGDQIRFGFEPTKLHLFDADGTAVDRR
jgi:multiple sugar transport system ATP-binding protein